MGLTDRHREAGSGAEQGPGTEGVQYTEHTNFSDCFTFNVNQVITGQWQTEEPGAEGRSGLVREKAGKRLSKVANGLGLGLLLAVASGARDPAEERGVAEGVEGISQGLRLIQQRMGLLLGLILR